MLLSKSADNLTLQIAASGFIHLRSSITHVVTEMWGAIRFHFQATEVG
jgi:hypothetical protein